MALLKPSLFRVLSDNLKNLEVHFRDCVEVEFTVENDELYFLETNIAKRSPQAAIKIALHMVRNIYTSSVDNNKICKICVGEQLSINGA